MKNGVVRVTNWVVGINKSIIEKSVIIGNKYFQRVTFLYYTASQYDKTTLYDDCTPPQYNGTAMEFNICKSIYY